MRAIGSLVSFGIVAGVLGVSELVKQRDRARRERDNACGDRDEMQEQLQKATELLERAMRELDTARNRKVEAKDLTDREVARLVVEKRAEIAEDKRVRDAEQRLRDEISKEYNRIYDEALGTSHAREDD